MTMAMEDHGSLILAAEDCTDEEFAHLHHFSRHDEQLILRLVAHGPVLVRGGRGAGKSALLMEAARRLFPARPEANGIGIYVSLRNLGLLRSQGEAYEHLLCSLISEQIGVRFPNYDFAGGATVGELRAALSRMSVARQKRIVLLIDDAAHIGREASLEEFFDFFRTISSSTVSCKAAIYPGVTRFGTRFDVLNDATVVDVSRSEMMPDFNDFFREVMVRRFGNAFRKDVFKTLSRPHVAGFLGRAVLGNMRAFVFACGDLQERACEGHVTLPILGDTLLKLSSDYYWPLLEELKPKLGAYEPMIEPAQRVAEVLFRACGESEEHPTSVIVLREIVEQLAKPFEILEYAGFIARREASRGMKSGGRGTRYALNLCNILEHISGTRLTRALWSQWANTTPQPEAPQMHRNSDLMQVVLPKGAPSAELSILKMPVKTLKKSPAYPYGLTDLKLNRLKSAGITTVGQLAETSDARLKQIKSIGDGWVTRVRSVIGQAVWM